MGCSESKAEDHKVGLRFSVDKQFNVYAKILIDDDLNLKILIDAGYLLDYKMPAFSRRTALHIAAEHGSVKCLKLLIALKANINTKDNYKITPVMLAARSESKECVEMLIRSGATIKGRTTFDTTIADYIPKNNIHIRKALSVGNANILNS